jgi:hypothetical protein
MSARRSTLYFWPLFEKGPGFVARLERFLEDLVFFHDFLHLGFDFGEVVRREAVVWEVEVVIKALFCRRADIEHGLGP